MRVAIVLAVSWLIACGPTAGGDLGEENNNGDPDGGGGPTADARVITPRPDANNAGGACDQMDLLFVIDNSGSMQQEQNNLIANFPQFMTVLESFTNADGDPIDYHVGVTTTGVSKTTHITFPIPGFPPITDTIDGEDGVLQTGACNMPRKWLERGDPDVPGTFSCAANVGVGGSPDEMPLEASRQALTDRIADGTNAGFIREDALLALVMLTDEQDCSRTDDDINLGTGESLCDGATDVATYVAALDGVKGDRSRWATAVIAGVDPGPCSSALGDAEPATRLTDFAAQVGANAVTSSICEGDLASALGEAMATFQAACNSIDPVE